jgi:hypothetical protein
MTVIYTAIINIKGIYRERGVLKKTVSAVNRFEPISAIKVEPLFCPLNTTIC